MICFEQKCRERVVRAFTSRTLVRRRVWVCHAWFWLAGSSRWILRLSTSWRPFVQFRRSWKAVAWQHFQEIVTTVNKERLASETVDSSNARGAASISSSGSVWTVNCLTFSKPPVYVLDLYFFRSDRPVFHAQSGHMWWIYPLSCASTLFFLFACLSCAPPPTLPTTIQTLHSCFVTGQINLD